MTIETLNVGNDLGVLAELVERWARLSGFDKADFRLHLKNEIRDIMDRGTVLLARDDNGLIVGVLAGFVDYSWWLDERAGREAWVFIDPEHQANGIGKLLVAAFAAWAKKEGCTSLQLTITDKSSMSPITAKDRFEKYGFDPYGFVLRRKL